MPKRPNNRPWPENLAYDFELPTLSPTDAEAFIDSLATSDRNKEFLRLRYREGKTYTEIAAAHGMTPAGVRLAIIAMQEKFRGEAASASALPAGASAVAPPPVPAVATPSPAMATPPTVPAAPTVALPHVETDSTKEPSRPLP